MVLDSVGARVRQVLDEYVSRGAAYATTERLLVVSPLTVVPKPGGWRIVWDFRMPQQTTTWSRD